MHPVVLIGNGGIPGEAAHGNDVEMGFFPY